MLDFSNESIKTSHSGVLSSLILGLWISSHLNNQSAKVGTAECAERLNMYIKYKKNVQQPSGQSQRNISNFLAVEAVCSPGESGSLLARDLPHSPLGTDVAS